MDTKCEYALMAAVTTYNNDESDMDQKDIMKCTSGIWWFILLNWPNVTDTGKQPVRCTGTSGNNNMCRHVYLIRIWVVVPNMKKETSRWDVQFCVIFPLITIMNNTLILNLNDFFKAITVKYTLSILRRVY